MGLSVQLTFQRKLLVFSNLVAEKQILAEKLGFKSHALFHSVLIKLMLELVQEGVTLSSGFFNERIYPLR